jgi:hypothetical protein
VKRGELEIRRFEDNMGRRKTRNRQKENEKVMQRIKGKYMRLDQKRKLQIQMQKYGKEDSKKTGKEEEMISIQNETERFSGKLIQEKVFKQNSEEFKDEKLGQTVEMKMEEIEKKEAEKEGEQASKWKKEIGWNNETIRGLKKEVLEQRQKKFEYRYEIMEGIVWRMIEMSELVEDYIENKKKEKEKENKKKEDSIDEREEREKQRVEEYLRTLGKQDGIGTISERTEDSVHEMEKESQLSINWIEHPEIWKTSFLNDYEKLVPDKKQFLKTLENRGNINGKIKRKNFMALPNLNDILKSLNRFSLKHHTNKKSFNISKTNKINWKP